MWDVIRGLVDGGTTLLLTTQYLEEADQLADRIIVVDGGRVIAEGTSDELKAKVGGELLDVTIAADAPLAEAERILTAFAVGPIHVEAAARMLSVPARQDEPGLVTEVVGALAAASIRVDALDVRRPSLDDVFIELTGHAAEPTAPDDAEEAASSASGVATTVPPAVATRPGRHESLAVRLAWQVKDALVLTRRGLQRIRHEPMQLSDVTFQPVIFVLLFAYVFGSAMSIGAGNDYTEFLVAGLFGMIIAQTAPGTTVGIATDMTTGVIDRFRSLPMSRSAVLAGRTMADTCTSAIAVVVVGATGYVVGWRINNGVFDALVGVHAVAALRLRDQLVWRLPGHGDDQRRSGAGHRVHGVPAAHVRVQRLRAHAGPARMAAADRELEPDQRGGRRVPRPVRQPQPVEDHRRVADAASDRSHHRVVDPVDRGVRTARRPPLPATRGGMNHRPHHAFRASAWHILGWVAALAIFVFAVTLTVGHLEAPRAARRRAGSRTIRPSRSVTAAAPTRLGFTSSARSRRRARACGRSPCSRSESSSPP